MKVSSENYYREKSAVKWEGLLTHVLSRSCGRYVQGRNNYLRGRGDSCLLDSQFSHAIGAHQRRYDNVTCKQN